MKTVLKQCSKCGIWGTPDDYNKNAAKKDGLQSQCKACTRERYENNREHILARRRERYERNREHELARDREYKERNREHILARKREHYEHNREQILAYQLEYRERNREHLRAKQREHRERNRELTRTFATRNGTPWTPEEDQQLLTLAETRTQYQIAVQLGRTQGSVKSRLEHLRTQGAA